MSRALTPGQARKMAAARKIRGGGRPKVPRQCPRCGAQCPGAREAQMHRCDTTGVYVYLTDALLADPVALARTLSGLRPKPSAKTAQLPRP